jgi:hypothetical protein
VPTPHHTCQNIDSRWCKTFANFHVLRFRQRWYGLVCGGIDFAATILKPRSNYLDALKNQYRSCQENMKSGSITAGLRESCGRCGKTVRMRDDLNTVLCTVALEVVDADFDDVCIHYEERSENGESSFSTLL